jgi:hypothetical protein
MSHNNFFVLWQGRNFFIRNLCPLWSECCTRFAAKDDTHERQVPGGQFAADAGLRVRDEARCMLLHQAVQRGLLGDRWRA